MADHGSELPRICEKVKLMPATWECFHHSIYRVASYDLTVVVPTIGTGHLGSIIPTQGQLKYLIIAMTILPSGIEAEALANITTTNVLKLFKRNILARFGVPQSL